jgi:VanZ family protein
MRALASLVAKGPRLLLVSWLSLPVWLRLLAPPAVMVTLWQLSSITPEPSPPSVVRAFLHNGAHIVAYATLASTFLLLRPLPVLLARSIPFGWALLSVLLSAAYGMVDEWHQAHVPGRVCSYGDLLSDFSGGVLGVVLALAVLRFDRNLALCVPICLLVCATCVSIATWVSW